MRKIVLFCAGGFSSSLLVEKMKSAAKTEGYECEIRAYHSAGTPEEIARNKDDADVVLIAPQIAFTKAKFLKAFTCPIDVIPMREYGMCDGPKVLALARCLISDAA